jgi:hypothetical protein
VPSGPVGFIDIEIVGGHDSVQRMLQVLDSALSPTGLAAFLYGSVGEWVKGRAEKRFINEGDDVSGQWTPLAQATVDIREAEGFGGAHPINKRTGQLEEYITRGAISVTTTQGQGVMRYPASSTGGELRDKIKTAQQGQQFPKTPARPVLGLNETDLSTVLTMLAFHIQHEGAIMHASP